MLEIENLSAGYGNQRVLHGVSLSLGEGQLVAVLGPNGHGRLHYCAVFPASFIRRPGISALAAKRSAACASTRSSIAASFIFRRAT